MLAQGKEGKRCIQMTNITSFKRVTTKLMIFEIISVPCFSELFTLKQLDSFSCFRLIVHVTFLFVLHYWYTYFKSPGLDTAGTDYFVSFEMFGKTCFLIFCFLVTGMSKTVSANDKSQYVNLNSVLDDKTPQLADQTFNINNWGLGKIELKLLNEIKGKIDSLSDKGKLR